MCVCVCVCVCVCIYIYIYIFQTRLVYTKKTSPLANYLLSVTFYCYLFVHGNFDRFSYDYFFYWAFFLVSHGPFSLCTIFLSQTEMNYNNDNDDKYNNNRHVSIEIINSEKTETT